MMIRRREILRAIAALPLTGLSSKAFSRQALKLVVGFPPGGTTDILARIVAEQLRDAIPAGVIVHNKPGASSRIAAQTVKQAHGDPSTVLLTPDFTLTLYPHIFSNNNYEPFTDFVPVATVARTDLLLVAGPGLPAEISDVKGYLEYVRQKPNDNAFGASGPGTTLHLGGEMLAKASGVPLRYIPYKGGAPALLALLSGEIPVTVSAVGESIPHIKAGKARALGCFGSARSSFLPDVPTMTEMGYKEVITDTAFVMMMPAGVPAASAENLWREIEKLESSATMISVILEQGMEVDIAGPASLKDRLSREHGLWQSVAANGNFRIE